MFDPVVRSNHEFGIVTKTFRDLIPTDYDKNEVEGGDEGKLTLAHFYVMYWFLLGSLTVAIIVFIVEFVWSSVVENERSETLRIHQVSSPIPTADVE